MNLTVTANTTTTNTTTVNTTTTNTTTTNTTTATTKVQMNNQNIQRVHSIYLDLQSHYLWQKSLYPSCSSSYQSIDRRCFDQRFIKQTQPLEPKLCHGSEHGFATPYVYGGKETLVGAY